jgi:hypothetical protein
MSDVQKVPYSRTFSSFTQQKAFDEHIKRGSPIPGKVVSVDGAIVTINFLIQGPQGQNLGWPNIAMPLASSEYVRLPIQAGDLGVARPSSIYLGGVSGLGGGTADLTLRGNLSNLVWDPIGNNDWSSVNPAVLTLYGPAGAKLQDKADTASVLVGDGTITMVAGGHTVVISSAGVVIDGVVFSMHMHTGVTVGAEDTGPVAP